MARISAVESDNRVHRIARLIIAGARTSECVQVCADQWGINKRQAEKYIAKARQIIRDDYSSERADFLAQKLALMDEVAKKALQSNQLGAVIGAARLQAELAQLL